MKSEYQGSLPPGSSDRESPAPPSAAFYQLLLPETSGRPPWLKDKVLWNLGASGGHAPVFATFWRRCCWTSLCAYTKLAFLRSLRNLRLSARMLLRCSLAANAHAEYSGELHSLQKHDDVNSLNPEPAPTCGGTAALVPGSSEKLRAKPFSYGLPCFDPSLIFIKHHQ